MSRPIDEVPGITDPVEIGAGGFGTVYRATQPAFDRTVAVKVLHDQVTDSGTQRRFAREAQAMGRLSGHPNIVVVHDSGITPRGNPYMVMAFEAGGSLAGRLEANGPLPWQEVCEIGVTLAGALQTAHDAGILHRDLKPANVLINEFRGTKLGDFGIAQLSGAGATTTDTGVTASIAHAPPEVIDGAAPSAASDVYSLASTLHTLLRGAPPFLRDTDQSIVPVINRIATKPPPALPVSVPPAVRQTIQDGLAKAAADRPASAAAFGERLRAAQAAAGMSPTTMPIRHGLASEAAERLAGSGSLHPGDQPTAPAPPLPPKAPPQGLPPPTPTGGAAPRRTLVIAGIALLGVVLVGAVALALVGGDDGDPDLQAIAADDTTASEDDGVNAVVDDSEGPSDDVGERPTADESEIALDDVATGAELFEVCATYGDLNFVEQDRYAFDDDPATQAQLEADRQKVLDDLAEDLGGDAPAGVLSGIDYLRREFPIGGEPADPFLVDEAFAALDSYVGPICGDVGEPIDDGFGVPFTGPPIVTLGAAGAVFVGMPIDEAASLIGFDATDPGFVTEAVNCAYMVPAPGLGYDGLDFMVFDGLVQRIDVFGEAWETPSGVGLGSTESEVLDAYGTQVTVEPHPFDDAGAYLVFQPTDPGNADLLLIFETHAGFVETFRVGFADPVNFIEGCA